MSLDVIRIKKYLQEITRGGGELKALVRENQLKPGSISLKAAKYLLIELAEGLLVGTARIRGDAAEARFGHCSALRQDARLPVDDNLNPHLSPDVRTLGRTFRGKLALFTHGPPTSPSSELSQ